MTKPTETPKQKECPRKFPKLQFPGIDFSPAYMYMAMYQAAAAIMLYYGKALKAEIKSMSSDFRTQADKKSEQIILAAIAQYYPGHSYWSEEAGKSDIESDYRWIADPLDGTNNFSLGLTNFTISVALQYKGKTIFAAILQPVTGDIYVAALGQGAYRNTEKIHVNDVKNIQESTVCYQTGYSNLQMDALRTMRLLRDEENCKRWMENWSPAFDFCMLATGKIEIIICYGNTDIYDFIAGHLIATEAGAKLTDYEGIEQDNYEAGSYLVTNGTKIHEQVLKHL
ncbi:MAG: inositol monophosphatase [Candidatus Berkelbacteria bacterium]